MVRKISCASERVNIHVLANVIQYKHQAICYHGNAPHTVTSVTRGDDLLLVM